MSGRSSERWYPPSTESYSLLTGLRVYQGGLVGTVGMQLDEALWSVTEHECAPTAYSQPILQFVGRLDLGDPDIVLVPLPSDSMRGLT